MRGVRIPQDLNGEDRFVLGLSVPRLAALLLGLLAAYSILHLSLPGPIQLIGATLAALTGAAVAWVRPEGRSLLHWALAAIEFKFGREPKTEELPSRKSPTPQLSHASRIQRDHSRHLSVIPAQTRQRVVMAGPLPVAPAESNDDVIELPDSAELDIPTPAARYEGETPASAPVYLGGAQLITFFSTKGGTGRTTLATEVAAILAMKGLYRESPSSPVERLRVALVDFDRESANVSARLGLAQPTMLDYLCDSSVQSPDPRDFVISHAATNLDVLLGPSKCLSGDRAELMGVAQAAHILSSFKQAGYQFLLIDMSASLGDLETYLLEASTRIYCVVTPTAGSVQSLYRGVEALRRLGLGGKLYYVANKMRPGVDLAEVMGDLNGAFAASVPYDQLFDSAENRHQPLVLGHRGATINALSQLAASMYPALHEPLASHPTLSPLGWFGRRRRAG